MEEPPRKSNLKLIAVGAATGLAYGLAVRYGAKVPPTIASLRS